MSDFDVITGPSIPLREPPPRPDPDADDENSAAAARPVDRLHELGRVS